MRVLVIPEDFRNDQYVLKPCDSFDPSADRALVFLCARIRCSAGSAKR